MHDDKVQLRTLISMVQKQPSDADRGKPLLGCLAVQLQADVAHFDHDGRLTAVSTGWHEQAQGLSDVQQAALAGLMQGLGLTEQCRTFEQKLDGWDVQPLEILYLPLMIHGQRLGGIFVLRGQAQQFQPDETLFAEMTALLYAMECVVQLRADTSAQQRMGEMARQAIGTLSYSELQAVDVILGELEGNEGVLVASRIADREQITRSVIVNALRKVESAGLIETRSLGMKGTYIRILNNKLIEELKYL